MKKETILNYLETIKTVINETEFEPYDISITDGEVGFQAHFDPKAVWRCNNESYVMGVSGSGYLEFHKGNVRITLTQ